MVAALRSGMNPTRVIHHSRLLCLSGGLCFFRGLTRGLLRLWRLLCRLLGRLLVGLLCLTRGLLRRLLCLTRLLRFSGRRIDHRFTIAILMCMRGAAEIDMIDTPFTRSILRAERPPMPRRMTTRPTLRTAILMAGVLAKVEVRRDTLGIRRATRL